MLVKLKAVYTLVDYIGAQHALTTISLSNKAPTLLVDVLRKLSILPERFSKMKRSSARARAMTTLSRAKAWLPELDPADISTGYPSLQEDDTPFDTKDFAACVKDIRPLASLIANETDLTKYQPAYHLGNQKIPTPSYKVQDLVPQSVSTLLLLKLTRPSLLMMKLSSKH